MTSKGTGHLGLGLVSRRTGSSTACCSYSVRQMGQAALHAGNRLSDISAATGCQTYLQHAELQPLSLCFSQQTSGQPCRLCQEAIGRKGSGHVCRKGHTLCNVDNSSRSS